MSIRAVETAAFRPARAPSARRLQHVEAVPALPPDPAGRVAVVVLDADRVWVEGNAAAARLAAMGCWSAVRGVRLEPVSAVTRAAFQAALRRMEQGAPPLVVPVYDLLAGLAAFATLAPRGPQPGCVLSARLLQPVVPPALGDHLRHLFDLTSAEAALAVALLGHGDLQQAAAALGITEGSARTRLQAVFEKTDTHRQVDLLRMLDALADSLAGSG